MTAPQPPHPFVAGLTGLCPRCGQGALFSSYLTLAAQCDVCGQDFSRADVGDGAAVFVMAIVGFLVVMPALVLQVGLNPPVWVQMLIWTPVAVGLCVALLRPARGVLAALQVHHDAHEARLDD